MTNIEDYIKELCNNCKNRNKQYCEIRRFKENNIEITKCVYYEREKIIKPIIIDNFGRRKQ